MSRSSQLNCCCGVSLPRAPERAYRWRGPTAGCPTGVVGGEEACGRGSSRSLGRLPCVAKWHAACSQPEFMLRLGVCAGQELMQLQARAQTQQHAWLRGPRPPPARRLAHEASRTRLKTAASS